MNSSTRIPCLQGFSAANKTPPNDQAVGETAGSKTITTRKKQRKTAPELCFMAVWLKSCTMLCCPVLFVQS